MYANLPTSAAPTFSLYLSLSLFALLLEQSEKTYPSLSQLSFFSPSASPPLHRHQSSSFFVTLLFINPSTLRFQFIARKTFCSFFIAISCGMKLKCLDVLEFFFPDIFL
ncbi:hypothetical protein ACSBR2_017225 [Camellia fascicularis]